MELESSAKDQSPNRMLTLEPLDPWRMLTKIQGSAFRYEKEPNAQRIQAGTFSKTSFSFSI